ncbi:MAG: imidazolonepropionase-like amidohydrolase, partial [Maricaulis maris]
MMKTILPTLALVLASATPSLAQSYAVTNGRVVTNTEQGVLASGTVLVRDGNIVAVGTDVSIPDGTEIIDADGGWITPGLFAP